MSKQVCKFCLDYRYLTEDNRPADGITTKFLKLHSCPKCNKDGKLYSKHKNGVRPYVRAK